MCYDPGIFYAWIFCFKYLQFKLLLYICLNFKYIKMENQNQERVFTPEELEAKRKEMLKYYKDSMPYLKAQFEHEEMLFKIDEVRFKRTAVQVQYATLMNQVENGPLNEEYPEDENEMPFPGEEPPVRKLKKQE
jgi:hypothetical protein